MSDDMVTATPAVFEDVKVTAVKGGLLVSWKLGPGAVGGRQILVESYVTPGKAVDPSPQLVMTQEWLAPTSTSVTLKGESGVQYEVELNYVMAMSQATGRPL